MAWKAAAPGVSTVTEGLQKLLGAFQLQSSRSDAKAISSALAGTIPGYHGCFSSTLCSSLASAAIASKPICAEKLFHMGIVTG